MTNDSDTIEQVCADLRGHDLIPPPRGAWVMYADRIEKVYDHERRSWDAAIVDQRAINRKLVDEMAEKLKTQRKIDEWLLDKIDDLFREVRELRSARDLWFSRADELRVRCDELYAELKKEATK